MADPIPMTQDQILAQLQTRGFETGFQRSPLRDFWGKCTSITGEMRSGQSGSFAVALYNFDEVEVIETVEPYISPIAQIEVSVSKKDKSKMGYLGTSIDEIINAGVALDAPPEAVKRQEYIIGKTLHMKLTGGHLIPSKDDATGVWTEKPNDCWVLMEIKGEGTPVPTASTATTPVPVPPTVDASAQALAILDGKTEQQWHQAVFVDPVVKADTKLIMSIANKEFLAGVEAAGVVTKDEAGVYHKV